MAGKVGPDELRKFVFSRLGAVSDEVAVGPAYGEDTAAIDLGDNLLVINSDPIIYAGERIGTLGVNIVSNDIAASGGEPKWLTVTYILPDSNKNYLDRITGQIHEAAKELGISIVGGHSEYVSEIQRPFLALTCLGLTERYIPTGGARPGDKVILTKGAGIEGTGILATDFESKLEGEVPSSVLEQGSQRLSQLSVIPESALLKDSATAMHDPTEGGIIDGLFELAAASSVELRVDRSEIYVGSDTKILCDAMNVDPLKIFGSGALIATVPEDEATAATDLLLNNGITATVIGEVRASEKPRLEVGNEVFLEPIRDQLYDLWG
ncbi:MAG: AIR synthase family protein [Candidatus Bipolaricaulota bacterium]